MTEEPEDRGDKPSGNDPWLNPYEDDRSYRESTKLDLLRYEWEQQDEGERKQKEEEQRSGQIFNRNHAVVTVGGKTLVLRKGRNAKGERDVTFMSFEDFRRAHLPDTVEIGYPPKKVCRADLWLRYRKRREYHGIVFYPGKSPRGPFNLWHGFAIKPKIGSCGLFLAHLRDVVCGSDEKLFEWVLAWFAAIVQKPAEPCGTAIVLRGGQGTGKSTVGEYFGQILGPHAILADDAVRVLGRFNAPVEQALFIQLDEATLTGNAEIEGRLKSLITSPRLMIERKGVDAYTADNFVRVMITTNSDRAIPANMDERRFCVLDVSGAHRNDFEYFAAIRAEAANGGAEALLHALLRVDLSKVNLRQPPRTRALRDQKLAALNPVERWWLGVLENGEQIRGLGEWLAWVPSNKIYDNFWRAADKAGARTKGDESSLGKHLHRLCPGVIRKKKFGKDRKRVWVYEFPPLEHARAAFERVIGARMDWPDDHQEIT